MLCLTKKTIHFFFLFLVSNYAELHAQSTVNCNNIDFELTSVGAYTTANAVSGWTISSQTPTSCNTSSAWNAGSPEFSIVSTPILFFPNIGTIINSPLGGSKVALLNNHVANGISTKLSRTLYVSSSFSIFTFAFAGYYQGGNHQCCEQAGFKLQLRDCLGNILSCPNLTLNASSNNCNFEVFTYTLSNSVKWTNWRMHQLDLSPFLGSCVTVEVLTNDCQSGDHVGVTLFDATCSYGINGPCLCALSSTLTMPINYCSGSTIANLYAPFGFVNYTWTAPPGYPISANQTSLTAITITNAVVNNVYTVSMIEPYNGCTISLTGTIVNNPSAISGLATNSCCIGGTSGSATVVATGAYNQYTYQWVNSTNSIVSTNSVLTNAPPGIYSVSVSSPNFANCGAAQTTLNIGLYTQSKISILKPFCGASAYFNIIGGTNYQWYFNNAAVSPSLGGTAPSFTITNATQGNTLMLTYLSAQGCQDSIKYTLVASSPGSMAVTYPNLICSGANNGQAVISLTPALGSPTGFNYFIVNSVSTVTPAYVSSVNPTAANIFSVNGLIGGASYFVQAFDGSCKYSSTFSTNVMPPFNFTLSPNNVTLCPGNAIMANNAFSSNPPNGYYTYTWSPNIFLAGNIPTLQNTIIQPTANVGSSVNIIYTVAVTPTTAFCPQTKTMSITYFNPITPSVNPPNQLLCSSNASIQLNVNPGGGVFYCNAVNGQIPIGSLSGVLNPSLAQHGVNTFTYSIQQGTCMSSASGNYTVSKPTINFPSTNSVCAGKSFTIQLSGANSYSWNTGSNDSIFVFTPSVSSIFTVVATNTLGNCSASNTIAVNLSPNPTVNISAPTAVCTGDSFSLVAQGANTYTWNNGTNNPTLYVIASSAATYSIRSLSLLGCEGTAFHQVMVHPNPTLSINGNTVACEGDQIKLKINGASSYTWANQAFGDSAKFIVRLDTNILVIGESLYACKSQTLVQIKVNPLPSLYLHGKEQLCYGQTDTIHASGATTYQWSNGSIDSVLTFQPEYTTDLSLVAMSMQHCTVSAAYHVKVNSLPNLKVLGKTNGCKGDTFVLKAVGALSFTWTNGSIDSIAKFNPMSEFYLTVRGADANACSKDELILLNVLNCDSIINTMGLKIFPNPTNGLFYVQSDVPLQLEVFYTLGELILSKKLIDPKNEIDLSTFADGFYILKLTHAADTKIYKLIKESRH